MLLVLFFGFSFKCLVGVRERTLHKHLREAKEKNKQQLAEMIVAASCGTKNNNASLQSNN